MILFLLPIILLIVYQNYSENKDIFDSFNKSILLFSLLIVFITELLSFFNILNLYGIATSWLLISVVLFIYYFKGNLKDNLFKQIYFRYTSLNRTDKGFFILIIILFLSLFLQGVLYPPNNWDSLTYHLSRIMYWLGNESVEHYPTHILRHLYQPPFAEYFIMHVNSIQGNDYFANSIQLLFLFFLLFPLNTILKYFGIQRTIRLISFLFVLSIPSVLLQATTTKNDIVVSYFILTSILFLMNTYHKPILKNYFFLGVSLGLGMLTKGTFYIFIAPFLLIFILFFIKKYFKAKQWKPFVFGTIAVSLILIINLGYFSRNYHLNGNILNIDETEHKMYSNDNLDFKMLSSNVLKNIGLHMGYPVGSFYEEFILNYHYNQEIFIDSPDANYNGSKYKTPYKYETHEDLVPNTLHFLLISLSVFVVFIIGFYKKNLKIILFVFAILIQFLLFSAYLKWQPWHTRLHIPIFILSSVLFGFFLQQINKKIVFFLLALSFSLNFVFYFLYNNTRPILTNDLYTKHISINDIRYKKYFSNQPYLYDDYAKIKDKLDGFEYKKIGLQLGDWEYPLLNDFYYEHKKIVTINTNNVSSKIAQNTKDIDVLVANSNETNILIDGKYFINVTPENKYIWLYKK